MMKKRLFLLMMLTSLLGFACARVPDDPSGAKAPTMTKLGYVLGRYNFSIDAQYDPRMQSMIPGYTSITVAIVNKGFHSLVLRPDKDSWKIKDRKGNTHKLIADIHFQAPDAWEQLDPRAQSLILYPDEVPPGYTQTFQLFVRGDVNLAGFQWIKFRNGAQKKTFTFTRY